MQLSICGSYADASDHAVFSAAVNKNLSDVFRLKQDVTKIVDGHYKLDRWIKNN